jgi:hypothetical protein
MVPDLAERIGVFLRGEPRRLCILQNPLSDASDPWVARMPSGVWTLGPDVYHVLDGSVGSTLDIETAILDARTSFDPPMVGILTSGDVGGVERRRVTTVELASLSASARTIFVCAYHGEAFIYWVETAF